MMNNVSAFFAGLLVAGAIAVAVVELPKRLEAREEVKAGSADSFVVTDSQPYVWSIESIYDGSYWETETEPWLQDGFVCFLYGRHDAEVWVPVADARVYKQAHR